MGPAVKNLRMEYVAANYIQDSLPRQHLALRYQKAEAVIKQGIWDSLLKDPGALSSADRRGDGRLLREANDLSPDRQVPVELERASQECRPSMKHLSTVGEELQLEVVAKPIVFGDCSLVQKSELH
jgi:hypothetical protein